MAREQLRHAQMQEELDRRRYGMPYAYPAPYMPAYTMAPPLYPDYGYRPYAPYPGQYPPAGVQSLSLIHISICIISFRSSSSSAW